MANVSYSMESPYFKSPPDRSVTHYHAASCPMHRLGALGRTGPSAAVNFPRGEPLDGRDGVLLNELDRR